MTRRRISDGGAELERARRNGTPLLFYLDRAAESPVAYGPAPRTMIVLGDLNRNGSNALVSPSGEVFQITHYQPLPAPPEDTAALKARFESDAT